MIAPALLLLLLRCLSPPRAPSPLPQTAAVTVPMTDMMPLDSSMPGSATVATADATAMIEDSRVRAHHQSFAREPALNHCTFLAPTAGTITLTATAP